MKKVNYLLTVLFMVALMSTSCEKENLIVPDQTLEEQYSEWSNLSWVSTDGDNTINKYPKLKINIVGDIVTIIKELDSTTHIIAKYTEMNVSNGRVIFSSVYQDYNGLGTELTCSDVVMTNSQTILTCLSNKYILH